MANRKFPSGRFFPLLFLAAACSSGSPGPGASSFTLTASPASLTVAAGATATTTVTAVRRGPNGGPIELALQGVPDGVEADAPAIAAGATSAVVSFRDPCTGNSVDRAPVTVRGTSGGITALATFSLTVQCPPSRALGLSVLAGAPGGSGDADDAGSNARFDSPFSVVGDGAGNLYVADSFNNSIRKIVLSTGAVTTFAGSRSGGFADGTGVAAQFDAPLGIARDGDALYVADTFNQLIRRIDLATGSVTTIGGVVGEPGASDGAAATAHFNIPTGIAIAGGSVFVADSGNNTIRRIDLATSVVTTLAGLAGPEGSADGVGSLARFDGPSGIVADGAGNLFVTDSFNQTIRKIEIDSATVTTFSGAAGETGSAGGVETARFNFPTGIASDGAGNLYVADSVNLQIRLVPIASRDVVTIAGVVAPFCQPEDANRLCFPQGLTVDQGTVYVADTAAHRIQVLSESGVDVVAGAGPHAGFADGVARGPRFSRPLLLASDGVDTAYVPDQGSRSIRKVTISSGEVTTLAGSPGGEGCCLDGVGPDATFSDPAGVALDGDALYVADTSGATIRKIVISTREVTTIAGAAGEEGLTDGPGAQARFLLPTGIAADGNGHLYVSDFFAIRQIDLATLTVTTLDLTFADAGGVRMDFRFPSGLALDGNGTLYVADTRNSVIRKVDLASRVVTTVAGTLDVPGFADGAGAGARFDMPIGVALDGAGALYVGDRGNAAIRKIDLATGTVTTVVGQPGIVGVKAGALPARLNQPGGIAALGPGRLIIADGAENVLLTARVKP